MKVIAVIESLTEKGKKTILKLAIPTDEVGELLGREGLAVVVEITPTVIEEK